MASTRNRLRILCLHGYRQNDVLFREKTGSLRKQFKKYADFEFISAPLVPNVESEERGDVRGWWFSRENDQFSSRDVCSIATGFEKSVSLVCEYVYANGPFDGILGFSQGASMAHLLLAMEKNGEIKLGLTISCDLIVCDIYGCDMLRMKIMYVTAPIQISSNHSDCISNERVYLHRRNKFIHAWLRISADDVTLERSKTDIVVWPLQFLRRYGYTSAGVFFFESGRRCPTGEGLHTFQSQNADAIFQLVQSRIQDNANTHHAETMRRNERARSSGPTMGAGVSLRCINPIQRYGSEGVGSEYLAQPSGYNSYHRGSAQRLRNVVIPPPPRPRSVGENEAPCLPPDSFHPHRHNTFVDQRIVGNIVSESTNPSAVDDISRRRSSATSQRSSHGVFSVPYVNISPQEVLSDAPLPPRPHAISTSSSQGSLPGTPSTVFPLRWDTGAGSTNVLCYTKPISPPAVPPCSDSLLPFDASQRPGRYVNITETNGRPLLERDGTNSPRPLNYAEVGIGSEPERVPSRCSSIGQRTDVENGAVNYTLIDAERTQALQAANGERRRNPTGH
ncbi:IRS-type PTB domain-containing protein [Trichostrongylus colubriformis]|uniref:IRS-type PTB domain-containing protein n=1 Tax=Trichostrongylus colubriformis TaxID=6319 RepID=A0AAN8IPQ1_TRICO